MREIKFRAWDKEERMMVTNFLVHEKAVVFYEKLYHLGEYGYDLLPYFDKTWENRFTLMQYTGLKDKNGKEIYEGDIVIFGAWDGGVSDDWRHSPALVEWDNKESAFYLKHSCNITLAHQRELEVIGNIYENPELISN